VLPAPDFDLAATLGSGQVFHWTDHGGVWWGALGDKPMWIRQDGCAVICPAGAEEKVRHFLALDHDMAAIGKSLSRKGPALRRAVAFAPGLRILRQPKWECLAGFITSPLKQIAHIRAISLTLREKYGERVGEGPDGRGIFSYPEAAALARAGESALRSCKLGYRAKGLAATAALVADGRADLEGWAALTTPDLRLRLLGLPGVGPKIADCVLLFAYGRLEAFPVDVWVSRAVRDGYFDGEEMSERAIIAFAAKRFGAYAGYAQQYLFHHARLHGSPHP
jgi:N-glycosylase/DNA lyase